MKFGKRCSSPFVTSFGMRMLISDCAALTRLLKACTAPARPGTAHDSTDADSCNRRESCEGPWEFVAAFAVFANVEPAAIVAAAPPTCDRNARRLELFLLFDS